MTANAASPFGMGEPVPGPEMAARHARNYGVAERYVVIGGGSQLAIVDVPERKYRQDGYRLSPLNNGTGDGWGYTVWYPARQVDGATADLTEWEYYPRANQWRKINRRLVAERRAAEKIDKETEK